ncbi:MAG: hypothetical protein LBG72_02070 [Spirochaetaceae bacterium]|jgi:hypothetical protein|nr:hypothetical protein [Spirochaetaceae bacterium]
MKKIYIFIFNILLLVTRVYSVAEFSDGRIKLVLDDRHGRFSLFYMSDVEKKTYEPMFYDKNRRTSYLTVFVDGRTYVLGDHPYFKTTIRGTEIRPALVFESRDVSITEEFSFIRTSSSGVSNGVRIDYKIENWSSNPENVGLGLFIDTYLGEKSTPHFRTDLRPIENETQIDRSSNDQWWVSRRNERMGLMGSIFVTGLESPDFVYFGNWKRMSESRWKPEYVQGRSFTLLPLNKNDSAVAYFMDVGRIERWQKRQMTVLLAAEDIYGFEYNKNMPVYQNVEQREAPTVIIAEPLVQAAPAPVLNQNLQQNQNGIAPLPRSIPQRPVLPVSGRIQIDIETLRQLIAKIDEYIYFKTPITEEELRGMEATLQRLRLQYGLSLY